MRVQQSGKWSNALTFTVAGGNITLVPNVITLVPGETHTIKAINAAGQAVTGLTWTTTDSNVVSLSTDDPPLLTALAVGHVTIKAGSASADVIVSSIPLGGGGGFPTGTMLWSNPAPADRIVPAVPSSTGVADVFAVTNSGMITAITSGGQRAWTASVNNPHLSGSDGGPSRMVVVTGTSASVMTAPSTPDGYVTPVLQAQDGSFIGVGGGATVMFDQSGNVRWTVPNEEPMIATDDGGVIAKSGVIYNSSGGAVGLPGLPIYSWTGNAYHLGPVQLVSVNTLQTLFDLASSFWAVAGGNYSQNAASVGLIRTFSDNEENPHLA